MSIIDDKLRKRFELDVDGQVVFAEYKVENSVLYITYVEAPPALRGTGAASSLMEGIVKFAQNKKMRIHPICSYAVSWLRRHDEYQELLA